ncbi:MAG: dTMP kinase [Candidatus Rokubacteria bacterium]|nr:dTMP kinase [Candidatus Rokubacteria bacterium]
MRGVLITIEGIEGSGKTTQCRMLADWLRARGHVVRETSEPDGTRLGEMVRAFFATDRPAPTPLAEVFLFLAARQQHVSEVIRPALERGEVVLCDRYADATMAYQGYGRGVDRRLIRELNALATGGLRPDRTLLLDLPAEVGLARLSGKALDAFERMDVTFHGRVRQGYLEIALEEPERVVRLRADQPVEALQAEVRAAVEKLFQGREVPA